VKAIIESAPSDVVLIAGKGHEDYQEIAGKRLPFSDAAAARAAVAMRGKK
jgi:UDP-N-acetylmuramoyl-L-alanyl-D-glutamate--2,6-diaminopimelate ligase